MFNNVVLDVLEVTAPNNYYRMFHDYTAIFLFSDWLKKIAKFKF